MSGIGTKVYEAELCNSTGPHSKLNLRNNETSTEEQSLPPQRGSRSHIEVGMVGTSEAEANSFFHHFPHDIRVCDFIQTSSFSSVCKDHL